MAPALHVTHPIAFALTDIAPSMRIVCRSNGKTRKLSVERYSLVKDIIASSRHAKHLSSIESMSMSAPLVRPLSPIRALSIKSHRNLFFFFFLGMLFYEARPRLFPPTGSYNPASPDALPPSCAAPDRTLLGSPRRPRRVQCRTRDDRLAPLPHHGEAVRRLAARPPARRYG